MKILMVAAEVGPFVSVGGLSQVMHFLPRALAKLGNDVRVFTPKFGAMDETAPSKKSWRLKDEMMGLNVQGLICNVKSYQGKTKGLKVYFLENREYYELRANVFGYKDDHVRFALLSQGCLEWLKRLKKEKDGWWPDVIHCHDWHTGYLLEIARTKPEYKELLRKLPIVLTVHNFTFQGNYDFKYCNQEEKDEGRKALLPIQDPKMQTQNPLKRGIIYADAVTTVSPTHAREVLTEEYGEGLDKLLLKERTKIYGILNGLDTKEFDPATDPLVYRHFTGNNFAAARARNKRYIQEQLALPKDERAFLMAFVGRLTSQKGMAILIEAMKRFLPEHPDAQLVVMGGGDDVYRLQLTELLTKYPKQLGLHLLPDFKLPRKIYSSVDAVVIPSRFEPGGIVALEAMRYGAVPIVRRTGGLNDVVTDFDPVAKKGNGFSFVTKDAWALHGALSAAITTYRNTPLWQRLVQNALRSDFSWEHAAKEYQDWYRRAVIDKRRANERLKI